MVGAHGGSAMVRDLCRPLRHGSAERRHAYRAPHQPRVGAAGMVARAATPLAALMGGLLTAVLTLAPGSARFYQDLPVPLRTPAASTLFLLTWAATRFDRSRKQSAGRG